MSATDRDLYVYLRHALATARPAVLATVIAAPEAHLVGGKIMAEKSADGWCVKSGSIGAPLREEILGRIEKGEDPTGKRVIVEELRAGVRVAIERFRSPRRLVVAGAGHIAQPVCAIASLAGLAVTVLDDRPAFADEARFPGAHRVLCEDFATGIDRLDIDESTSVVIVTRGHLHDLEVLRAIKGVQPAYVGMIGSRRRVLTVVEKLRDEGFSPDFIDRLYAPIGLDIGAESPEEIALAIVAEVVAVLKGGRGTHLSGARSDQWAKD